MKNTSKDRYEHKLQQFLKDVFVGQEHGIWNIDDWLKRKDERLKKKKELHNKLNSGKQDHYDEVGEQEIKDEDDFLGDITDGFYESDWIDYDYEQDHNKE